MRPRLSATILLALALAAAAGGAPSGPAPLMPAGREEIVFEIPGGGRRPIRPDLAVLRGPVSGHSLDRASAVRLATHLIESARLNGEPERLGQAEAVLQPWWNEPAPPAEIRLLRASLRQAGHHFAEALDDLRWVVERDPSNLQAWVMMAGIQTVKADYAQAARAAFNAHRLGGTLEAVEVTALIGSLTGRAALARDELERAVDSAGNRATASQRAWGLTLLAEIESQSGDDARAEQRFNEARRLTPSDLYLLGAWADWLLDHNRPAEVVDLLQHRTHLDPMLLRLAIAEQRLSRTGRPPAALALHRTELAARFAAGRQQGESQHLREEARFLLEVQGAPLEAVRLARQNWDQQREPADARILLESALAAHEVAAAAPAIEWMQKSGIESRVLGQLRTALTSLPAGSRGPTSL